MSTSRLELAESKYELLSIFSDNCDQLVDCTNNDESDIDIIRTKAHDTIKTISKLRLENVIDAKILAIAIEKLSHLLELDTLSVPDTKSFIIAEVVFELLQLKGFRYYTLFPESIELVVPAASRFLELGTCSVSRFPSSYVLIAWLTKLILVPFPLESLQHDISVSLNTKLNTICIDDASLSLVGSKCYARFLNRNDCTHFLKRFVKDVRSSVHNSSKLCTRYLTVLVKVFKLVNPKLLLEGDTGKDTYNLVLDLVHNESLMRQPLIAQLTIKLAHKYVMVLIALNNNRVSNMSDSQEEIFRVLTHFILDACAGNMLIIDGKNPITEQIENASIVKTNSVSRIAAAKGLASIAKSIELKNAALILDSVISLFQENRFFNRESLGFDNSGILLETWHGACLSVAEMTYFRLVTSDHMSKLLQFIELALVIERQHGSIYMGADVRDAGCYIMWSLYRYYTTSFVDGFLRHTSILLLCVALTDRELNVRRAAGAAVQEGIGRHSIFQDSGLKIAEYLDFYNLSNEALLFDNIIPKVLDLMPIEIANALIENIFLKRDMERHRLATSSLKKARESHSVMLLDLFEELILPQKVSTVEQLHASIVYVVAVLGTTNSTDWLILHITKLIDEAPSTWFENEYLLLVLCEYITKFHDKVSDTQRRRFIQIIYENGDCLIENHHDTVALSFNSLALRDGSEIPVDLSISACKANKMAIVAVGTLLVKDRLQSITILKDIAINKNRFHFENRAIALDSMRLVLTNLLDTEQNSLITDEIILLVMSTLQITFNDYETHPARGDVGSFVRLASIRITPCIAECNFCSKSKSESKYFTSLIGWLLRLIVGINDKIRIKALQTLKELIPLVPENAIHLRKDPGISLLANKKNESLANNLAGEVSDISVNFLKSKDFFMFIIQGLLKCFETSQTSSIELGLGILTKLFNPTKYDYDAIARINSYLEFFESRNLVKSKLNNGFLFFLATYLNYIPESYLSNKLNSDRIFTAIENVLVPDSNVLTLSKVDAICNLCSAMAIHLKNEDECMKRCLAILTKFLANNNGTARLIALDNLAFVVQLPHFRGSSYAAAFWASRCTGTERQLSEDSLKILTDLALG